jgi:ribosomal protein S12 methylthiotransferase
LRAHEAPCQWRKKSGTLFKWREVCPEIVIRSTFIAGFPGETEEEFYTCWTFVREAEIDRAGCFAYSAGGGAIANDLPGMLPVELREERRARFMAVAEAGVCVAKLQHALGQPCRFWWTLRLVWARRVGWQELCRCTGDRWCGAAAAARENQQNTESG